MMDRTPPTAVTPTQGVRPTPTDRSARATRLDALKSARNPGAHTQVRGQKSTPERGRTTDKLGDVPERPRSRSRNYDIFLPKQSHIHTPKRQQVCANPDKITHSATPSRTLLSRSASGTQNYRTSLSAVSSTSRDELNSSSNTLDSSNDAISIHSDAPFRKRTDFAYMSLPHGRSGDRFKSVEVNKVLRDYHRDKDRARLELYDITTGKPQKDYGANDDDDKTPTAVNGHGPNNSLTPHHVTFDSATTPSTASSCGSPASQDNKRRTPLIQISDVNGNRGNGEVIMENGGPLQGGKPLITAEYYCVKRVNYDELKQKFGNNESEETAEQTDEAVKKLNLLPVNGEKEKKSLASSISNFFRKMSPRLNRKSRGSERSSNSSMADDDSSSQGSPSHVSKTKPRGIKSPISSPIRRFINGKKHSESDSKNENITESKSESKPEPKVEILKKELEVSRSLPPSTLNVEGRVGGLEIKKRGLLSTRSTDSIGDCSLDVNMAGSDPSLASGHQSCSVSKRTLHSTEPPKTFSHPDSLNQNQDTLNQNLPNQDPQKYSYLGLSVSVGGYPKYRSYKSQERALNESSDKPKSKTSSTDSSDKHEDVINANNIGGVKFASTVEQETDTSDHTVTQKSDGAEPKTEYQNGHANLNNSAGVDDDVFVSDMRSSHVKQNVTHMEGSSGKRVSVNGTPVVHGGAAGEGGAIQVVPTVDVTTRTRELRRGSVAKGGPFYLARVAEETARLRHFVSISEADLAEAGKTEEVYGKLRAAVGKANLLVTQKFKQFIGLCDDNLHPKEGTVLVTNEDLAGFWDMMTLQVEDVDAGFTEIQQMRDNDWAELSQSSPPPLYRSLSSTSQKESTPEKPKRTPKKSTSASNAKPGKSRADKSRDEARKRLMEAKRLARRKRLTSGSSVDDVEIYVSEPDNKHTS